MNKLIFILILLITFPVLGGSWIRSSNGKIPLNTIKSGWEANNDSLYLCAVSYKGGVYLGKIRPEFKACNFAYNGKELAEKEYFVLVGKFVWENITNNKVPKNTIALGLSRDKENLHACRGNFKKGVHIVYVSKNSKGCLVSFSGKAYYLKYYQILVDSKKLELKVKDIPNRLPVKIKVAEESKPKIASNNKIPKKLSKMVYEHNLVRKPFNLKALKWSSKLADYALTWANYLAKNNNCKMKHRPRSGKYKQKYGENLYWASAVMWSNGKREIAKKNSGHVVRSWASEVSDYNYRDNSCKRGKMCGHYTQIVWSTTTEVGCAMVVCGDKSQLWVCNYNPPGNYRGVKPY